MIIRRTLLLGAGALALTIGVNTIGQAVELDPKAVAYIKPDDFKWRNPPGVGPNNGVSFWGDGTKPGFYGGITQWNKGIHWDGAKEEDAMLLIIGDGPATNTPAQQTEGKFDGKLNAQFVTFKAPDQFVWRDPSNA